MAMPSVVKDLHFFLSFFFIFLTLGGIILLSSYVSSTPQEVYCFTPAIVVGYVSIQDFQLCLSGMNFINKYRLLWIENDFFLEKLVRMISFLFLSLCSNKKKET